MKNYKDRKNNKVGGWMYWNKKHSGLKIPPKPIMFVTRNSWGVKTCNSHMFALSHAREFSFLQVPYLEREEKITDRSNFVNEVTKFYSTLSGGSSSNNHGDSYKNVTLKVYSRWFPLVQFVSRLYRSSEKQKESRCIAFSPSTTGHFHVVVV